MKTLIEKCNHEVVKKIENTETEIIEDNSIILGDCLQCYDKVEINLKYREMGGMYFLRCWKELKI